MISRVRVLKFRLEGGFEELTDDVAVEEETRLYVDGRLYAVFYHSPAQVKEMVIGYLLTEGVVSGVDDVLEMEARGEGVYVKLPRGRPTSSRGARAGRPPGAAGGEGEVRFSVKAVLRAIEALSSRAATFRATGGTHVAAVANREGELVTFAEDVGRHNAIDKAIGEGAIKRVDFSRSMLAFSGRLSYEVVAKVASVGVPVLASVAAPTDRGLRLAEALGLTLIGFARGGRFNVYTSPSRIEEYARLIDSRGS